MTSEGYSASLTNVKTRGGWSEWQLGALLAEMLTPDQFAKNMKTRNETDERVEFAIKLPGDEKRRPGVAASRREIPDGTL
jgi:DNA recombination protein RmuC